MRIQQVLTIALAEARLTRRLVRFWVFLGLAYAIALFIFLLQYSLIHGLFSSYSATAAMMCPRFLIAGVGVWAMVLFMFGSVFLAIDVRARDQRERMAEVLDSRPMSNLELVAGKWLGVLASSWLSVVGLAVLLELVGALLRVLKAPIGELIEPHSLLALVVLMAIPALALCIAMTQLVAVLVRNRIVAAVLMSAALIALVVVALRMPVRLVPWVDIAGGFELVLPSDIVPGTVDPSGWVQRSAVLLLALGLLGLTAALHPRLDDGSRQRRVGVAVALVLCAVLGLGAASHLRVVDLDQLEQWRLAHERRAEDPAPDIERLAAKVAIDPGKGLSLSIDLDLRAPQDRELRTLLLSFNPGLTVTSAATGAATSLPFTHEDGLLELELPEPLQPGATLPVHFEAAGRLNTLYGYLDSAKTPEAVTPWEGQVFLLGYMRALDDRRYVALMPGARWLPVAGADVGRDDGRRPRDFFAVELEVELPSGWLAAGPGRREEIAAEGQRVAFRFAPGAPVHEAAVLASRFVSYSTEIAGVHLEALLYPGHTDNVEVLAEAEPEIRKRIEEILTETAAMGLSYPYNGFTVVEVPTTLRGYEGGWRLDTAMAPPTMVLMREMGFPTARFDSAFRKRERFADREGGIARAKRERLESFFVNDFSGGNLLTGAARSFLVDQTTAAGPEGPALNFVLEELSSLLIADARGYFSVHMFTPEMNQEIRATLQTYFTGPQGRSFADAVIEVFGDQPEVWQAVLGTSLADMDPWADPARTVNALVLKGGALAESLRDQLGRERVSRLLANLRETYRGRCFEIEDFVREADAIDPELGVMINDWLTTTALPGFVGVDGRTFRVADEDGNPRYQVLATVRNDEETPGLLRMVVRTGEENDVERIVSDPIRLGGHTAVEYGVVASRPVMDVWVRPYLSLNRERFRIPMVVEHEGVVVDSEAFVGTRELPWQRPDTGVVVVDDLDEGFTIVSAEDAFSTRLEARGSSTAELDAGLPIQEFGRPPARWSRASASNGWGRYRHTVAWVHSGRGATRASFAATIPRAGRWELEIHLPDKGRFRLAQKWGTWSLEVVDGQDRQKAELDAQSAGPGWSPVGSFELSDGEIAVELSDSATGTVVIADAIRWLPPSSWRSAVEESSR